MRRDTRLSRGALISASVFVATACWSQSLTWLGTLPGGLYSRAHAVSADSTVVVGVATTPGRTHAFRWTRETGMVPLGPYDGTRIEALAASADGNVIVGFAYDNNNLEFAFRWTPETGVQRLVPSATQSWASGVSADGSIIVGWASDLGVFFWTPDTGAVPSGGGVGGVYDIGISADGSTIVGSVIRDGVCYAARWTREAGLEVIDTLGGSQNHAFACSADGSVVVGRIRGGGYWWQAFRWTRETGIVGLGTLGGNTSTAFGVSGDGSVVVGISAAPVPRAFRWTPTGGMENLNVAYAGLLTGISHLTSARAVSPDGRYIVGVGLNNETERREAFLLDTGFPLRGDVNRDGCVDDADLIAVLFAFGERGYRNEDINWNGVIDDGDLLQVLFHFGDGCE
jgi:probable HAF family extracellular repeat protein